MKRLFLLELRHLVRSSRGQAVMFALSFFVLASVLLGALLARAHDRAGARDAAASKERIRAAAGTSSTAFDLAAWSDTFVARGALSSAGLVAGDLAALPDSMAVRIYEPPTMVPSLAERSPAASLLGALDLAWVLALILPLAAIALGFDAVARDREKGTLAMLVAPAGTGRWLIAARALAASSVLALGVVPAAVLGYPAQSLITGLAPDPWVWGGLFVLLLGYVVFLAALVISASALADRSATALAVSIGAWLLAFVAVPLAAAAVVRAAYPMPDPRARLDGELAAQDVFQKPSAAILDEQAEKDRALDPSLGKDGISVQNRYYMLLSRERYHRAKAARYEEDLALSRRIELTEISAYASPSTIVSMAMAELAGTAPNERIDFAADGERYRRRVEDFVRARVVENEERLSAPDQWPSFARRIEPRTALAFGAGAAFFFFGVLILAAAIAVFDRMEIAPTREDA